MNIITALINPEINKKLKEVSEFNIICNDIQYEEALIETLEKNGDTELIIISELLPGEHEFKELINKIKMINSTVEIIVILKEKNEEIKNYLISKGIFSIFYNNQITIENLIKIINEKNNIKKENKINEEIKILKKIILENNRKTLNKKILNISKIKNIKNKIENKTKILKNKNIIKEKQKNKIISVVGANGVGKSIFSSILVKVIKNKKILLIDFDIFSESINSGFGIKKQSKKNNGLNGELNELVIKLDGNIDLICATRLLFDEEYHIEKDKIKNMLEKYSNRYDLIIIDTTTECFFDYTKEILEKTDLIFFLTEANLIELKKSRYLLDIYINKWKIEKNKINVIFNKINKNSIDEKILKILFSDFNILGKIKLNNKYNLIINNHLKNIDKKINKEYLNILKKIN